MADLPGHRTIAVIALVGCVDVALAVASPQTPSPTTLTWAKPDHFWYRRSLPNGNVWVTVDARHGVRQPLFDHQRLAIELGLRTGVEYKPLALPFADPDAEFVVKYDGSNAYIQEGAMAIEFVLDGYHWRCELEKKWDWNKVPPTDYECLSGRAAAPAEERARSRKPEAFTVRSPDGRWEALIRNHNVAVRATSAPDETVALSSDGTAVEAYLSGSIQWSADSSSLTAYRVNEAVWLTDAVTGTVKQHIAQGRWTVK